MERQSTRKTSSGFFEATGLSITLCYRVRCKLTLNVVKPLSQRLNIRVVFR